MTQAADLFSRIALSDAYLLARQDADGAWRQAPDGRVLENALTLLLCRPLLDDVTVAAASRSLRVYAPQTHSEIVTAVDGFLLARLDGVAASLDLRGDEWRQPAAAHRLLFFAGLGYALGWQMLGAPPLAQVEATLWACVERAGAREMKRWTVAECCAVLLLLGHRGETLLGPILAAQDAEGSFGLNPLSTAIVVAGLAAGAPGAQALADAIAFLEREVVLHGSWRFAMAEVWDTALMLRALSERRWQMAPSFSAASGFVIAAQNPDGGWPYRLGVESDTDSTGMAAFALRLSGNRAAADRAVAYLAARRTSDGLWRTWHDSEDPPAEDAIAHAVLALTALGRPELCDRAHAWLARQCDAERGWTAHWYNSEPYSAAEIGAALGRRHPMTRYAVKLLLEKQRGDGGWAPRERRASTAAATGMALGLLADFLSWDDERVQAGMGFLFSQQAADGRFIGATDMYAPRPFAVDYAMQTHALALTGVTRWANKLLLPARHDRRLHGPRRDDRFLSLSFDAAMTPVALETL